MSCYITYNNKNYTEKDFKEYLKSVLAEKQTEPASTKSPGFVQASEIYNKLGNKTVSNNVKIVQTYQQAGVNYATKNNAIFSLRVNGSEQHFGNPFSSVKAEIDKGLTAVSTTKEAVEGYIAWVINSNQPRAKWIRKQLKSGELKNKNIIYYKELGEPSHATALDYLINNYNWNNSIKPELVLSGREIVRKEDGSTYEQFATEEEVAPTPPPAPKQATVFTPEMIRARVKSSFDANGYMDIKEENRGDKVILGAITRYIMATKGITTNNQIIEANKTFKLKDEVTLETVKEGVLRIKIKEDIVEETPKPLGGLDMSKLTSSGESMANDIFKVKEGVSEVFKDNESLASIGTEQQYSQYLDTIFPDSKVKDIVYRSDKPNLEKFSIKYSNSNFGFHSGIFLSTDIDYLKKEYGNHIYSTLIDIKNLVPTKIPLNKETVANILLENELNVTDLPYWEDLSEEEKEKTFEEFENNRKVIDGVVGNDSDSIGEDLRDEIKGKEYVVINEKQIHILGSKQDVKGFKDFVSKNKSLNNIEQGLNATVGTLPTVGDKIPFIMPNGDSVSLKVLDETNDMYTVEFPDGTKEEISPMELGLDSWETSKGLKRASTIKKSIWKDVSKNFQSIKYNTDNLKNSKFSNIYNKIKNNQEVVSKDFSSVEEFKEFVDLLKFTYQGKELPILYHGSASLFSNFKEEFLGKYTGAPSAKQAFFAAKDLDTAASYGVTEKHYHDSYEEALERYEDQYIEKEFDFQSSEKNYAENKAFKNEAYADYEENTVKVNTNIYPLFFISDNTLISDVKGNRKNIGSISKVLKDAKEENYDSVIFKDIYDGGFGGNTDVYTVFSSKQIINIFDLINSQLQTKQDIEGFKDFVSKNKSLNNIEQAFKCK